MLGMSPMVVSEIVHEIGDSTIASVNFFQNVKTDGKGSPNFNDDGTIKNGSNLSKYITYCGQRTSQYGLKDASITDQVAENKVASLIKYTPIFGDIIKLKEALEDNNNRAWITGEACVASDSNPYYSENRWYAAYSFNERLRGNMNPDYTTTTSAYFQKYYEENPLDQSFEGVLARFSGLNKEAVEDGLALIEYYNYLDEYKPETRYSFIKKEDKKTIHFENTKSLAFFNILSPKYFKISYSPIRHRTITV